MVKVVKPLVFLSITLVFMLSTSIVQIACANPYLYHEAVLPPPNSKPPNITVDSPYNNSNIGSNVNISIRISTKDTSMICLLNSYLTTDWLEGNISVYKQNTSSPEFPQSWNYSNIFSNVPDGKHEIVIYASGEGSYVTNNGLTINVFFMTSNSTIIFTSDNIPPKISIISPSNTTYTQSDIPLNFTLSENSAITYSIDNQETLTYSENITINGLTEGKHNLTIYAKDLAGNMGSQTVAFTVAKSEPFPTTTVAIISGVAVVFVIGFASLLLYRKHQKTKSLNKPNV
jgi:hypothetical protein